MRGELMDMSRRASALTCGCVLGVVLAGRLAADTPTTPAPVEAPPPNPTVSAPAASAPAASDPAASAPDDKLSEVVIQTNEPKFVAPTRRDRIGRIWAPVLIDGKGPYRLVLDTGANRSAITARTAQLLGADPSAGGQLLVTGFTGSATVPIVHVSRLEVGELLFGPSDLPVLADVFGGAQGVLSMEGQSSKRIYADFTRDYLEISRSRGEPARRDFAVIPLRVIHGGLLVADVHVGSVRCQAIIDTGAQGTVGNTALRNALMRHPPREAAHEDIIGVTLDVQGGDNILSPDIDFGHLQVHGIHITFGDMYLFQHWKLTTEPTLTLGMDLLGSFDVLIIDYARHEMQVRPRGPPAFFY